MSSTYLENLFSLSDQVAVVIGGTGVLGGALCDGLAQAGAAIVVAGRDETRGSERVEILKGLDARAAFVPVDAAVRESVERLLAETLRQFGQVDMLVNCAGMNSAETYFDVKDETFDAIVAS